MGKAKYYLGGLRGEYVNLDISVIILHVTLDETESRCENNANVTFQDRPLTNAILVTSE